MSITRDTKKVEVWEGFWEPADCKKNSDKLFIFGDNVMGNGKGGQAVIRDESNSYGLPTKSRPSMKEGSFFRSRKEAFLIIGRAVSRIQEIIINDIYYSSYHTLVFSANGYGNARAKLDKMYPGVYKWLHRNIANMVLTFGGENEFEKLNFIDNNSISILMGKEF